MRHRKKINSLGRKAAHRKETMSSMATALILNKRINTTVAKAKALRTYVEPLITRSKTDNTHSRRMVFSYLKNKHAVSELFREVAQKVADRPGGYTRILKTGFRKGDAAEMCFIELVDYNTAMLATDEETQQKRTRRGRRRGKKKETAAEQPVADTAAPAAETDEAGPEQPAETPADDQVQAEAKADTPKEEKESAEAVKETPKAEETSDPEPAQDKEADKPEAGKPEKDPAAEEKTAAEEVKEEEKPEEKQDTKAVKSEKPEEEKKGETKQTGGDAPEEEKKDQ